MAEKMDGFTGSDKISNLLRISGKTSTNKVRIGTLE
jgi:hypothetical protein